MNDLFSDKSKVFCKIKEIILKPNSDVQLISSELETTKDLKDLKSVVDFLIREQVLVNLKSKDIDKVKCYLKLSTELSKKDLSNPALPFILFSDVLNALTIQSCENFFSFMEECILKLKDSSVFVSGRALLLRICNDLLRRLSKSQNTVFCGKIQIFLSRLFPLDEKSGLNLMGHFNTDNVTPFNDAETEVTDEISIDLTDEMMTEDGEMNAIMKVNRGFYRKFWMLQDFFRNSCQIYDDDKYHQFTASVDEVLSFFSKFRVNLDNRNDASLHADWSSFSNADMTFTKYLTSEKLFDLQLMDPNFRRCVLMQLAVTFQYLLAPIKFKTPDQVLKDDQLKWLDKQQVELNKLLDCLSSDREPFARIVRLVLDREANKSSWKNEGCPSFVRKRHATAPVGTVTLGSNGETRDEKRSKRIQVDRNGKQIVTFDTNTELGRLWNICPDNLAACRDPRRSFNPNLTDYFANARMELDPEEKVEEKYRSVSDERWCWSSLRLLSRRSQHFYTNWTNPGQPIKQYLTTIIMDKLQPSLSPVTDGGADVTEAGDGPDGTGDGPDGDCRDSCSPPVVSVTVSCPVTVSSTSTSDVVTKTVQEDPPPAATPVLRGHICQLSQLLGDRWRRLGEALQFNAADLAQLEPEKMDADGDNDEEDEEDLDHNLDSSVTMLNLWLEGKSSLPPTRENLMAALRKIGDGWDDVVGTVKGWGPYGEALQ